MIDPRRPAATLTAEQRHPPVVGWTDTGGTRIESCLHELFEAQVDRGPDSVAVIFEDAHLTYRELDSRANRLAHHLRRFGVGPERIVGIMAQRQPEAIVALLAALKAGGAYLPLDPLAPAERLDGMLRDAGATAVIGGELFLSRLSPGVAAGMSWQAGEDDVGGGPCDRSWSGVTPGHLAYVLFTSGSTGRPKGVAVEHRQLVHYACAVIERMDLPAQPSFALVSTLAADLGHTSLFPSLVLGGRLHLISEDRVADPERMADYLGRHSVDAMKIVPSHLAALRGAQAAAAVLPRRQLILGGEASSWEEIESIRRDAPALAILNHYGPTETTVGALTYTVTRIPPAGGRVPLGAPLANVRVRLLAASLEPVPFRTRGEIHIGGAGLARGYLGRPDLTAERFIPDPFAGETGGRLYRTGDLGLQLPDGSFEFLGRVDHQVKIRGFRIELGEIEAALAAHSGVRMAVVTARESSGGKRLAAYFVPLPGGPDPGELRSWLKARLPEIMVPADFTALDELPLTPNGKVDRRALPEIRTSEIVSQPTASTPIEEMVSGIWADVLERGGVGSHDDFFELGGHSLMAARVIARLREALGIELRPSLLFEHPTPARFAAEIEFRRQAGTRTLPPLERASREEPLPASFGQERLWLYDQLEPGSNAFNVGHAVRLKGNACLAALDSSLAEIFRRHEVLRTRIVTADRPLQVIDPPPLRPLTLADLSALPGPGRERAAQAAVLELQSAPFELARGPLLRAALLRLAEDDHVLSLTTHHILSDGWSLGVLLREVMVLYGAFASSSPSPLTELPFQYADFAVWQRRWLEGGLLEEQLDYWLRQLGGDHGLAIVPTDRPPACAGGPLEQVGSTLPRELLEALVRLGREQGVTLFMILVAAVKLLIHRYTGRERIAVGSMHANRTHSALEDLIGLFVNVLPLQTTVSPDWTFRELLRRVRDTALEAYAHHDTPYEKILARACPDRSAGRNALFQVMVILQNMPLPPLRLPGLEVTPFDPERSTKRAPLDLTFSFVVDSGQLLVWVEYDSGLFERRTAERLLAHLQRVLSEVTRDPAQRLFSLPHLEDSEALRPARTLRLTDRENEAELEAGPSERVCLPAAQEKAVAIQDQVAARRSKLSEKQLALLNRRLKKN